MSDLAAAGQSVFDAWERRDFDAMVANMSDDVTITEFPGGGQPIEGKAAVKEWYQSWVVACPDSVADASVAAASDDTVVVSGVYAGTNTGTFGPFAATGRSVSLPYVNVLRFDSDGQLVRIAAYFDQLTLLTQLGHMEAPAAG